MNMKVKWQIGKLKTLEAKSLNKKQPNEHSSNDSLTNKHSLICNDELFFKDLMAIVDDTMRVEEDETNDELKQ